ncbi:hypothetical protein EON65_59115, partial [archaeon]
MEKIEKFLDLPPDIVSSFCSEWLDVAELAVLVRVMDRSRAATSLFSRLMRKDLPIYHAKKAFLRLARYLEWAKRKDGQFKDLCIGERSWKVLIHPQYAQSTQCLEKLHILPQRSELQAPYR